MTNPSELGDFAVDFTETVAESLASSRAKQALSWIAGGRAPRELKHRADFQRRQSKDHRISGLDQRLRVGCWLQYHRETGAGKCDSVELTQGNREALFLALVREAQHYDFYDRNSGSVLETTPIVDAAVNVICTEMKGTASEDRLAIILVEAVARYLLSKYNVLGNDRRQIKRRMQA